MFKKFLLKSFENKRCLYNHILMPDIDTNYCRIPKNGCTSIRYSIAAKLNLIDISKPIEALKWVNENTETLVKMSDNKSKFQAKNQLVFLRDPFKRVISSYLDRVVNDKDKINQLILRKTGKKYGKELNFEDFVKEILPQIYLNNPHFVPQSLFMRKKIQYNHKYNLSKLNELIKTGKFFELTKLEFYNTNFISNHTTSFLFDAPIKFAYKFNIRELEKLSKSHIKPSFKSFYNEELLTVIQKIYKDDYSLYETLDK